MAADRDSLSGSDSYAPVDPITGQDGDVKLHEQLKRLRRLIQNKIPSPPASKNTYCPILAQDWLATLYDVED